MNPKNIKVINFLVEIFQFEFLVITEKNIFTHKLFFAIKYSDFNILIYFYVKIGTPPPPK